MTTIEDTAIAVVAEAVCATPQRKAMAAALMRWAGNTLARLTNHDEAARQHTALARMHFERIGRGRP